MDHFRNQRPRLPRHYVPDPRLENWADGVMNTTLTAFSGPAGYGKTSAVVDISETLESRNIKIAWLRVEPASNVPETLFTNIVQALNAATISNGSAVVTAEQVNQNMLLQIIQDIREAFVLVLDDFEYLKDEICLRALSRVILQSPENAHFIVASRNLQDFPLSRLKLEDRLQLVSVDALQFDKQQVRTLLNGGYRLDLNENTVSQVATIVENWPAGLQMIALFLQSGRSIDTVLDGHAKSVGDISAYLWEEVFLDLPDEIQHFLMNTSFLDRLNGELCNCVTNRKDSKELLDRAYNANLFLTLMDEKERTYRYHNLFAEFLRNKLNQSYSPSEIRLMHEKAAAWHITQLDFETALQRLFEVEAWDMACQVLGECSLTYLGRGRVRTVLEWFETLPEIELRKYPGLLVAYGWTLILGNKLSKCYALVQYLKKTGEARDIAEFAVLEPMVLAFEDRFEECRQVLPAAFNNTPAETHLAMGVLNNIEALLQLYRRNYPPVEPLIARSRAEFAKAGAGYGENYAAWIEVGSLLSQGHLTRAHLLAEKNWSETINTSLRFSSASALAGVCLAQTLFHQGKLSQARNLIIENFDILCETALNDSVVTAVRIVNRIHCLEGNLDLSGIWLSDCSTKTRDRNSERVNRAIAVEKGYLGIRAFDLGRTEKIPQLLSDQLEVTKSQFTTISEDVETGWMHNMRVMIRTGRQDKNLSMLKRQIQMARAKHQGNLLIKLNILHAQALDQSNQRNRALKVLEDCARDAAKEGFITHFHEEGPAVTALRNALCETMRETQYLKQDYDLVTFLKGTVIDEMPLQRQDIAIDAIDKLTGREAQAFELLGFGLTNGAISTRMSISPNTVKFHLKNIYTKLEIDGRAKAVSYAASIRSKQGTLVSR